MKNKNINQTKYIALIAIFSAMATGGKMALAALPNIEIVSLIIISIGWAYGWRVALPTSIIFCTIEMMIFGFGTWVLAYYIHFPLLALMSSLLRRTKFPVPVILVCIMTFLFGVLTTAIDVGIALMSGVPKSEALRFFAVYYGRGTYFFLTHIIGNTVIVCMLFLPIQKLLKQFNIITKITKTDINPIANTNNIDYIEPKDL